MKWWPWQKIVGILGALIVFFGFPYARVFGLTALGNAPGFIYDLWRTHVLGETWVLWTDYGTEATYSRQKSLEQCEALRAEKIHEDQGLDRWWNKEGYPQCMRERRAECNLRAVQAQSHGMSYAEVYRPCVEASPCPERSREPTQYVCLPAGKKPGGQTDPSGITDPRGVKGK